MTNNKLKIELATTIGSWTGRTYWYAKCGCGWKAGECFLEKDALDKAYRHHSDRGHHMNEDLLVAAGRLKKKQ